MAKIKVTKPVLVPLYNWDTCRIWLHQTENELNQREGEVIRYDKIDPDTLKQFRHTFSSRRMPLLVAKLARKRAAILAKKTEKKGCI